MSLCHYKQFNEEVRLKAGKVWWTNLYNVHLQHQHTPTVLHTENTEINIGAMWKTKVPYF